MLATWGAAIWMTLTTLWFWITVPVVALLVGITVEVLTRNQTSRRAAIYRALVTMLVAPAVFYGIQRVVETPERAAEVRDNEKRDALLTDIAARAGNPGAAQELIELRARALFAPSTGDAERFAQELVTQLSEKKVHHKALQDASAMEAMRLRLDWEPFLRAFLEQFDQRVAALQSRGIDITITPADGVVFMGEVLLVQPGPRQQFVVRYAPPTGGYELRVRVRIGQVELGKLTSYPAIYLVGTGEERDRHLMEIDFGPNRVTWNFGVGGDNRRSGVYLYRRAPPQPPQGEEEYRQAVRDGLSLAFEYALLFTTK
jgi:hypothetical protein